VMHYRPVEPTVRELNGSAGIGSGCARASRADCRLAETLGAARIPLREKR